MSETTDHREREEPWRNRRRDRRAERRGVTPPLPVLRERVYATLVGLAAIAALLADLPSTTVGGAAAAIGTSMGALWLASTFADLSAHRVAEGHFPRGKQLRHIWRTSAQTLEAAALPLLSMAVAALGWWSVRTALIVAACSLVFTIVVFGGLATRHTAIRLPGKLLIIAVEVAIAVGVVAIKYLAH